MFLQNLIDKLYNDGLLSSRLNNENNIDINIKSVTCDSRKAGANVLFFLFNNSNIAFLKDALKNGTLCIVSYDLHKPLINFDLSKILFASPGVNIYELYSKVSSIFFNLREKFYDLNLCAVTGTNGKSSVVYFYKQLCDLAGFKSAYIGTLGCSEIIKNENDKCLTTPDAFSMHSLINKLALNGITDIALEASSHGLNQYRVNSLPFRIVAFTNFSQDHLDYHGNMEEYWNAKCILFNKVAIPGYTKAVINLDDDKAQELIKICTQRKIDYVSYGTNIEQDANVILLDYLHNELTIRINSLFFELRLSESFVSFQVSNLLCAISILYLAHSTECIKLLSRNNVFNIISPPGRMQHIYYYDNNIYIDFAHTPDALENVLRNLKQTGHSNIIILFGCGGDRDKEKRPLMGKIAEHYANTVILTSDNSRSEETSNIINNILSGMNNKENVVCIEDRYEATKYAIGLLSKANGTILIAGKGHETKQEFKNHEIDYNDYDEVSSIIRGYQ